MKSSVLPPDYADVHRCMLCARGVVVWGDDVVGHGVIVRCAECLAQAGDDRWLLIAHEHDAIIDGRTERLDDEGTS